MIEDRPDGSALSPMSSDALERHIRLRTAAQVRGLQVESVGGLFRVRGYTTRYYVKQLVLAALRELDNTLSIDLNIEVC
jgi:hypothetical protein